MSRPMRVVQDTPKRFVVRARPTIIIVNCAIAAIAILSCLIYGLFADHIDFIIVGSVSLFLLVIVVVFTALDVRTIDLDASDQTCTIFQATPWKRSEDTFRLTNLVEANAIRPKKPERAFLLPPGIRFYLPPVPRIILTLKHDDGVMLEEFRSTGTWRRTKNVTERINRWLKDWRVDFQTKG